MKARLASPANLSGFPFVPGAGAGTRTRMANRPRDFKSLRGDGYVNKINDLVDIIGHRGNRLGTVLGTNFAIAPTQPAHVDVKFFYRHRNAAALTRGKDVSATPWQDDRDLLTAGALTHWA